MSVFITAAQTGDSTGAAALLDNLPKAQQVLADHGYDAEWFGDALDQHGLKPCIPCRKFQLLPVTYDKRRNRIETMLGGLAGGWAGSDYFGPELRQVIQGRSPAYECSLRSS